MRGNYTDKTTEKNRIYLIVNISQPRIYPHVTYLAKISQADLFVVSDDLWVNKNSFEIRNKYLCRLSKKPKYLNAPILSKQPYNRLKLKKSDFSKKHMKTLRDNYLRHPHFDEKILTKTLDYETENFMDFYLFHLKALMEILGIETKIALASAVNSQNTKQDRLIDILNHYEATEYLSGVDGQKYITNIPVKTTYHDTLSPKYNDYADGQYYMIYDLIFSKGIDFVKELL